MVMGCEGSQLNPYVLFLFFTLESACFFFVGDVTVINVFAQLDVGMCMLLRGRESRSIRFESQ